jgi:hypothetical protein
VRAFSGCLLDRRFDFAFDLMAPTIVPFVSLLKVVLHVPQRIVCRVGSAINQSWSGSVAGAMNPFVCHAPDGNHVVPVYDDARYLGIPKVEADLFQMMRCPRGFLGFDFTLNDENYWKLVSGCEPESVPPGVQRRALLRAESDYNISLLLKLVS